MAEAAWHPWHNVPARWCNPRLRSKEVSRIPTRYADHRRPEDQRGPPVFHPALSAMTARCSGASLSGFGSGLALGPMGRPHGRPDFAVRLIKGASRPASPSLILGRGPPRQGSLRDSAAAPCPRLASATLDESGGRSSWDCRRLSASDSVSCAIRARVNGKQGS